MGPSSLADYTVESISRDDAAAIILRYEWLGTLGHATEFVGLISPRGRVHGVACFGYGPGGPIRQLIGEPALCLERGACVHYAPANAASFLINRACKLIYSQQQIGRFFAYAEPAAGEYGAVYQAAGWHYLGQGLDGRNGRKLRMFVLPPGVEDLPTNWRTTRELRRGNRRMSFAQARAEGWTIKRREAKHVYATNVGRDRRAWRKAIVSLPYPAPRPQLKISA